MKHILSLLLFLFVSTSAFSQCTYVIDMQDSFGDGWNGASLDVTINGTPAGNYTLANGSSGQQTFSANHLDIVTFTYNSGTYDSEVTYQISIQGGPQLFADGPNPFIGLAFTHQCGGCDPAANVNTANVTLSSVDVSWTGTGTSYLVSVVPQGSPPGMWMPAASSPFTVNGLLHSTTYTAYVRQICASGDTSVPAGPATFNTPCGAPVAPWIESFNSNSTPNCWTESGSESWRFNTGAGYAAANAGDHTGNGGNYAWIDGSFPNGANQISTLTSPPIDVSGLAVPLLSYWIYSHNNVANSYNTMLCEVYDGANWNTINTVNGDEGDGWKNFSFGLQGLTITGNVQVRFTITENAPSSPFYNDILIDDVEFKEAPNVSAAALLDLQPTYCNTSVATRLVVSNQSSNIETDVQWIVESNGVSIASGIIATLNANASDTIPLTLGGVGPAGPNATIVAYTALSTDQNPNDDTTSATVGMSYTSVNANMASAVGCMGGNNGSIMAAGHSGVGMYTYQWDAAAGSQTVPNATGLIAGSYTVTVTDSIGCEGTATLTLLDPPVMGLTSSSTDLNCNGDNSGTATATPTGGVPNYTYMWSTGSQASQLTNAPAGTHTVTVTDNNGCSMTSSVTLAEPAALVTSVMDNNDGTATATASGGTPGYTYQWDPAANDQTTATATGLTNGGVYYVVVTDANGCSSVVTIQASVVTTDVDAISNVSNLKMFPNPTSGNVFVALDLVEQAQVDIQVTTVTGQVVLNKTLGTTASNQVELETANLPTGVYMVQFAIGSEQLTKKLIITK